MGSQRGRGQAGVHVLVFWALESSKMRIPGNFGLSEGGAAGVHVLVFWALESSKMRTPGNFGLRGGGAAVHVLVFWALESSKMRAPRQFWVLRERGRRETTFLALRRGGGRREYTLKVPKCVLPGNFGL